LRSAGVSVIPTYVPTPTPALAVDADMVREPLLR
jgi:hypothetical protein